jgi:hypothetical protein
VLIIKKIVKYLSVFLLLVLLAVAIWIRHAQQQPVYQATYINIQNERINQDILLQLHFLKEAMHHQNAALEQQFQYPEGFIFSNALYGLAWIDFAQHLDKNSAIFKEAETESRWAWEQTQTEDGIRGFSTDLPLARGAFYKGWTNYLLGKLLCLNTQKQDNVLLDIFTNNCKSIQYAFEKTQKPYLESYGNQAWPADNVLCLASLKMYKKLTKGTDFERTTQEWLSRIKANLDTKTQLVPHEFDLLSNKISLPRGSSQSLMNCFWRDIDSAFAKQQFEQYRNAFLAERLGFKGMRESLEGAVNQEDIDSGPVIWGIGGAASVVGVKAFYVNGDTTNAALLSHSIETFGFPKKDNFSKQYLWGEVLILDLFRVWTISQK